MIYWTKFLIPGTKALVKKKKISSLNQAKTIEPYCFCRITSSVIVNVPTGEEGSFTGTLDDLNPFEDTLILYLQFAFRVIKYIPSASVLSPAIFTLLLSITVTTASSTGLLFSLVTLPRKIESPVGFMLALSAASIGY